MELSGRVGVLCQSSFCNLLYAGRLTFDSQYRLNCGRIDAGWLTVLCRLVKLPSAERNSQDAKILRIAQIINDCKQVLVLTIGLDAGGIEHWFLGNGRELKAKNGQLTVCIRFDV